MFGFDLTLGAGAHRSQIVFTNDLHPMPGEEEQSEVVASQRRFEVLERSIQATFEQSIFLSTENP